MPRGVSILRSLKLSYLQIRQLPEYVCQHSESSNCQIADQEIAFDFECDWMKLYVGKRGGSHVLGCGCAVLQSPAGMLIDIDHEFTQLIKGYQGERLRQAFHFFDQDADGYINPDEFQRIIIVSRKPVLVIRL
jgi:hypothetical protein